MPGASQCQTRSMNVQVHATIPPFLLCAYAAVGGPGSIMRALCVLCALSSVATGLAAMGILWAISSYNSAGDPPPALNTRTGSCDAGLDSSTAYCCCCCFSASSS